MFRYSSRWTFGSDAGCWVTHHRRLVVLLGVCVACLTLRFRGSWNIFWVSLHGAVFVVDAADLPPSPLTQTGGIDHFFSYGVIVLAAGGLWPRGAPAPEVGRSPRFPRAEVQ